MKASAARNDGGQPDHSGTPNLTNERTAKAMGHREARRVPPGWEHPRTADGHYVGLIGRDVLQWYIDPDEPPDMDDFMPEFPAGTATAWQLYETTSKGTPVSPVFDTAEHLAAWCEGNATVFADYRWTAAQWLASFRNGSTDVDSLLFVDRTGMHVGDPERAR